MKAENGRESFGHRFRTRRRAVAQELFPSTTLFFAGVLTMPALLFNPSVTLRIVQCVIFFVYAWSVGKRTSLANTLLVSASIVAFNLIVPYGRVIATFWGFELTQGALLAGLEKAATVEGLIMLSKSTVRSDFRLPGRFGAIVGESFRYFELIMEKKAGIDRKDPIGGIDRLLIELSAPEGNLGTEVEGAEAGSVAAPVLDRRRAAAGRAILAAAVLLAWSPLFLAAVVRLR